MNEMVAGPIGDGRHIWQPEHLADGIVRLSPLLPGDFEELYAVAADPLIWEQHPNPDRYKRDVFKIYFEGALSSGGALVARDPDTGAALGSSRFYDHLPDRSEVKIGYTFFSRACWGRGVNPSVKRLMLAHAFQHVGHVLFQIGAGNIRSQIAIVRLGAVKTGEEMVAYHGEAPKLNYTYRLDRP